MDVAHNEQGLSAVLNEIQSDIVVVCGFSKNKDIDKMLQLMI